MRNQVEDSGISLGDILREAIQQQHDRRWNECRLEALDNRRSFTLVGFADNRFYPGSVIAFPPEYYTVPDFRKFGNVSQAFKQSMAITVRNCGRLRAVIIVRGLTKCGLAEATRFVDFCSEYYEYSMYIR